MNWVKKTALTLSMSLLVCAISFAQSDLRRAKKYIELQDFETAITNLNRIVQAEPGNQEAHIALADAYRLSNRLPESHAAFSKAQEIADLPVVSNKTYGDVLMALNDYPGALEQYSLYGTEYVDESVVLIEKCSYAIAHAGDAPKFKISEEYINTPKRDFGPAFFGEELVYLSNRTDMNSSKGKELNHHVNIELLKASKDSKGVLKYPKRIKSLTGQEFNIISIAYNPTLEMVAVTKGGQYDNINLTAEDKCTLYIGKFDRLGTIENLKPYEFNKTDFSTGFASFSVDGMTMYFASDRTGGEGGFDIYESKMVGGEWSAPINLGPEVNTPGNEITPSRTGDMLLFASDSRAGFGGYDMFMAYEGPAGFVNAENLGTGINSSFDEYGMIYDAFLNVGYLTSTRSQGRGLEDIYRVVAIEPLSVDAEPVVAVSPATAKKAYEILKGMTLDVQTGEPIINVAVSATTDDESTIISATTNDKGMFSMPLVAGKYYNLSFESDRFMTASRTIKMESARRMPLMKIEMEGDQVVAQAGLPTIQPVALGAAKKPIVTKTKPVVVAQPAPAKVVTTKPLKREATIASESPTVSDEASKASPVYVAPSTDIAYAIQIAAISKNEKSNRFANVKDLGSLYTLFDSKVYKVRCGLYTDRAEAEEVLKRIKVRGYESAFIVVEKPTDSMDLVMMDFSTYATSSPSTPASTPTISSGKTTTITQPTYSQPIATSYKVRLATYSNPKWFDQSKVEGPEFGYVEILMNEGKSIYMLTGFSSLQDAQRAHRLAKGNGFVDAYVVKDENGKLSKIK